MTITEILTEIHKQRVELEVCQELQRWLLNDRAEWIFYSKYHLWIFLFINEISISRLSASHISKSVLHFGFPFWKNWLTDCWDLFILIARSFICISWRSIYFLISDNNSFEEWHIITYSLLTIYIDYTIYIQNKQYKYLFLYNILYIFILIYKYKYCIIVISKKL